MGGKNWKNGELPREADDAGFVVLVTTDKNIRYQQNLRGSKIDLVVLGQGRWSLIRNHVAQVIAAVNAATPGQLCGGRYSFRAAEDTELNGSLDTNGL